MRTQVAERHSAPASGLLDVFALGAGARAAAGRKNVRNQFRVVMGAPLHGSGNQQWNLNLEPEEPSQLTPAQFSRLNLRHPDICERVLGMHASGHGTADIKNRLSMYVGEPIPSAFVDAVLEDLAAEASDWRRRPLETSYPIIIFERARVRCRDGASAQSRTCHIAIGFQAHGPKEVLGFWFETGGDNLFWRDVLNDLRDRGVEDVIYLVGADPALSGAQRDVFATATMLPHVGDFVRQSQDLSTSKSRCTIAKALRPVHGARSADEALSNLERFEASALGTENPSIAAIWRRNWAAMAAFFEIAPEIRCVMTSTFAVDGLRLGLKMALSRRKYCPSSEEAATLIYLVARQTRRKWKRPQREWHAAKVQLALSHPDRLF